MTDDPADYDTDDRVFCEDCREWGWPDSEDVKLCDQCEERYCIECMKEHKCYPEGGEGL